MLQKTFKILLAALFLSTAACSQRWYEVDPGASEDEINQTILNASGLQTASSQSASASIIEEIYQNGASVYFKSSANGFPVRSLLQIMDMGIFKQDYFAVSIDELNVSSASIAFLDGFANDGQRYFALIINMTIDGAAAAPYIYVSQPGDYEFSDESLIVYMYGDDETPIALMTHDLDDTYAETLGTNVQFTVTLLDNQQGEIQVGKFAPLAGLE